MAVVVNLQVALLGVATLRIMDLVTVLLVAQKMLNAKKRAQDFHCLKLLRLFRYI